MARNLDMTALRSFVAVADTGGVTKAAAQINLTQSAVSMQLKRLELALGQPLFDRSGRGIALTAHGEQLLSYGRRLLALNDEVWARMTDHAFEGSISFGVPHDIVYPHVPRVLQQFAAEYPRINVQLISSYTRKLKDAFARGGIDLILTTENGVEEGGETLARSSLVWVGAPGGAAWRSRPLRLAFENGCIFRPVAQHALDDAGIPWEMAVRSDSSRTIEATVSADLAVHVCIADCASEMFEIINHTGRMPELPRFNTNLYAAPEGANPLAARLAGFVRAAYSGGMLRAAE
ncbi:MAG: LysR family transcriptional regulator [Paracoccaceae bacterium]